MLNSIAFIKTILISIFFLSAEFLSAQKISHSSFGVNLSYIQSKSKTVLVGINFINSNRFSKEEIKLHPDLNNTEMKKIRTKKFFVTSNVSNISLSTKLINDKIYLGNSLAYYFAYSNGNLIGLNVGCQSSYFYNITYAEISPTIGLNIAHHIFINYNYNIQVSRENVKSFYEKNTLSLLFNLNKSPLTVILNTID